MKKITYILLIILFCLNSNLFAQMSVKSNVFATNVGIFVKQNVDIQSTGNVFLRNEAQLLQGTTSTSTNTGAGKLSLYQEGTSSTYQYNYWCSPVGNASATAGNENFGITMLNRPTGLTTSTPAITSHHLDYNGIANPLDIETYWIWKYITNTSVTDWIHVQAASTLAAGEGFTMKGSVGVDATTVAGVQNNPDGKHQRYDFAGKPNDGNISISVLNNNYTLTGNPYPSAIDLTAYLIDATNTTGTAYFWEDSKTTNTHFTASLVGGYGTFTPISRGGTGIYVPATFYNYDELGNPSPPVGTGQYYERMFCPVGQGFMVLGSVNGTVTMKNEYRVFKKEGAANFSQFERNAQSGFLPATLSVSNFDYTTVSTLPTPQIIFKNRIGINGVQSMVLAFEPTATDGVDFAMDAPSPKEISEQELYFLLDNKPYIVDVIHFDINKRIPIGLRNQAVATYKISVEDFINFTGANTVYIHDKINDIYYDIVNNTFEVTLPAGNNTTQYEITFTNSTLSTTENTIADFDILQNNTTQNLTIQNPKLLDINEINLFDLSGKLILNKSKIGVNATYKISTSTLAEGVYIAKVTTIEGKIQSKKVSVFKVK